MIQNKINILSKAGLTKEKFSSNDVSEFTADNQSRITDYIHHRDRVEEVPNDLLEQLAKVEDDHEISITASGSDMDSFFLEDDEDFIPRASKSKRNV